MDATITNLSTERVFIPGPQLDLAPTGDPNGNDVKSWNDIIVSDLDGNVRIKELVVAGTISVSLDGDSYDVAQAVQGSMVAFNLPIFAFADLPTAAADGAVCFVSNGRKVGEGAGAGTGVPAYWDVDTTSWLVFSTDAAVAI